MICDKCKKEIRILIIQRLKICDCGLKVATKQEIEQIKVNSKR